MKLGYLPNLPINILWYLTIMFFIYDKGSGGGVCTYVKDVYKNIVVDLDIVRPHGVEDVWLAVQSCKLPSINIGCLYRYLKSLLCTYDYITDAMKFVSLRNIILSFGRFYFICLFIYLFIYLFYFILFIFFLFLFFSQVGNLSTVWSPG